MNSKARMYGMMAMMAMMGAQGMDMDNFSEWKPLTKDQRTKMEARKAKFRMDKLIKTQGVKAFEFPNGTFYGRDFKNAERKSLNEFNKNRDIKYNK